MPNFLPLTNVTSGRPQPILINAASVISIHPNVGRKGGARIKCVEDFEFDVSESFDEVLRKINYRRES